MSTIKDVPTLVGEAIDLSKEYLRQETIEPAKKLGRVAGFSLGAGLSFSLAALLLTVAGRRWLIELLPDGELWSGVGYLISAVVAAALAVGIVALGRR